MERTGVTPRGAVSAPDLAELLKDPGPLVSLYLTTESDIENAAYKSEQRWKSLRREIAGGGAPEGALAAIDPLVPDAHHSGQTLAVIANDGGVLHVEHAPDPPPADRWSVSSVPLLLPLLTWRQAWPPYLTVRADRAGADICVYRRGRAVLEREGGGDTDPLARSKPGGWSQLRYQHRAENTWEHNADDVARHINELVDRYDTRLVVLAGDVRAVEMIRKALPPQVDQLVDVVEGSRSEDGSDELFTQRVNELVTAAVNVDMMELLSKFREELGQADRAADGPDDTLAALTRAQVEVLLVADVRDDQRTAYYGPSPNQVGRERNDLRSMGVEDPGEERLVDVAVRAALGTGAAVEVVPDGDVPTGRIGAILRWS